MKKILIIRLSSLGDILLTTPLVRFAAMEYPGAHIDFCLKSEYTDVMRHSPYINGIIGYPRQKEAVEDLLQEFGSRDYDLIIDLQHNLRSGNITKRLNGEVRRFHKRSWHKFLLVHFKINKMSRALSIPERYLIDAGIPMKDKQGLEIFLPEGYPLPEIGNNTVVLCPGSRHFTKMWPEEYFIEAGNLLRAGGFNVALAGGKSDREICASIAAEIEGAVDYSNDDDLFQTAAILKKSRAAVCNDSGLMHLSCAVHTPVVVLFGSTVREFGFIPYRNLNIILENNSLSCRPCSHIGRSSCPKKHFACMREIEPAQVYESINILLSRHE